MEPLKIGNIILPHRAVFGPMAGFTDAPCRSKDGKGVLLLGINKIGRAHV